MIIKNIKGCKAEELRNKIERWFNRPRGRFIIRTSVKQLPRTQHVDIHQVRLRVSKEFCGNHPAQCEIGNPDHRKAKFLEGADWVQFNDELNTILDRACIEANIASTVCVIRKGALRRVSYLHHYPIPGRNAEWNKTTEEPDDWQNYMGTRKFPEPSDFPRGTPGTYRAANHIVIG